MLVGSYTVNVNGSNTVYTYTYDEENRIESVTYSDGETVLNYYYDATGYCWAEEIEETTASGNRLIYRSITILPIFLKAIIKNIRSMTDKAKNEGCRI